ncbi:hypothetical protein E3U43_003547 [Larimichthys crocea]|uniref:Uncharacterized protein n=1 Tax=Larimichthys crocea TaxID=215358 RepID=A0ACD3RIA9_LARCR|nr:hypothetical protein E3U43_003547 [Larimichthys crocea]
MELHIRHISDVHWESEANVSSFSPKQQGNPGLVPPSLAVSSTSSPPSLSPPASQERTLIRTLGLFSLVQFECVGPHRPPPPPQSHPPLSNTNTRLVLIEPGLALCYQSLSLFWFDFSRQRKGDFIPSFKRIDLDQNKLV